MTSTSPLGHTPVYRSLTPSLETLLRKCFLDSAVRLPRFLRFCTIYTHLFLA